jgi:hypothetical protein
MNPSFEETKGCLLDITNISTYNLCTNDDCYQPIKWSKDGCITTISSDVDMADSLLDYCHYVYKRWVLEELYLLLHHL